MAAPHGQQPWNNAEKVYLLAEILKYHCTTPERLIPVVNSFLGPTEPNWNDIPLPPGRSLNSSRFAFHELRRTASMQSMGHTPIMSATAPTMSPMSAPLHLGKRSYPFDPTGSYSAGREIRPKPSSSFNPFGQASPLEQPPKKKRGRPTKAEAQARAEAQTGSGEPSPAGPVPGPPTLEPAISRPQVIQQQPGPLSIEPPPSEETRPPPMARMQISSMLTPTGQKSNNSQSSSSSGKRRRGRSTRSDLGDLPQSEETTTRRVQEYESPYARMSTEMQESPARTAVLRHRDDPVPPQSYRGAQQPNTQDLPPTTGPPSTGSS